MDLNKFKNPPMLYHGTDFWMLNGKLTEDEIIRQLTDMKKQGVYSFIARTYIGLQSDYPGKDFKSKLRTIINTAKQLDMKLFLQAGYMPEHVLGLPAEYSLGFIEVTKESPEKGNVICRHNGLIYSVYDSITFLDLFSDDAVKFYLKVCYEDIWQEFSEEYGKTILSVWVDEPSYSNTHLPYPRGMEQAFCKRWGYSLNDNIYKLFIDEGNFRTVRYHYRKLLQDMMEENYFKNLHNWCSSHGLLASGHLMCEDTLQFQLERAGATMPFYKYFDIPGIDVLEGQMNWRTNAILPSSKRNYFFPNAMITTPLQCISAAHQAGAEHILCEMYGVASQDMDFKNQKNMFDHLAALGINHRCVHGMFYSLHGRSKRTYPPHVNYYQPYWNDLNKLYSYVASASQFISFGKPCANVLVIHPLDSAYCEYTNPQYDAITGTQPSRQLVKDRDTMFHRLLVTLKTNFCEFELGDEKTIEDLGRVENGNFVVGKMAYDTVVLPDLINLQSTTVKKLKQFSDMGGKIIVLGMSPQLIDGYLTECTPMDGINAEHYTMDSISCMAQNLKNSNYSIDGADNDRQLFVNRTENGDETNYFIFNIDCSASKNITFTVYGTVTPAIIDGFTKLECQPEFIYKNGNTVIKLHIPEGGSVMLYTKKAKAETTACKKLYDAVYPIDGLWSISRCHSNVLLLEFCKYKCENGSFSDDLPILAVQQILSGQEYSGMITQKFVFFAETEIDNLSLALEDAGEHVITFNGSPVCNKVIGYYHSRDFETVALPACKKGENVIELTRRYTPLPKVKSAIGSLFTTIKGTELESIYLLGNFAVNTQREAERNGNLRYSRHMSIAPENSTVHGELTACGYPFFAGTVKLSKNITFAGDTRNAVLHFDSFNGCIGKVTVNGIYCGDVCCPPYKVDISKALLQGENTFTIEITNTLRNLLGPYHRPEGEIGSLFMNGYGNPNGPWMGNHREDPEWYTHHTIDNDFWTDSYMMTAFGIEGTKIICPVTE